MQSTPQSPQCLSFFVKSVHVPPQQPGLLPVQALPQAPHCMTSVIKLTQLPLQQVCPAEHAGLHADPPAPAPPPPAAPEPPALVPPAGMPAIGMFVDMHLPAVQRCPLGQTISHAPQLFASVCRFVHAAPQQPWPVAQARPHMPQFFASRRKLKGSSARPLQSSSRPLHTSSVGVTVD